MWDLVGNPEDRFSQNEAQFIFQSMASGTDNMTDKVFQHLRNIAPEDHQKLKEDRASYKEIHTLIEKVINENLSLATSLRGKVQHASSSDIQRLLSRTYTSGQIECMRHGLEVESFRMSIDRNQQGYIHGCRVGVHVSKWLFTRQPFKILSQIGYLHGCRVSTYNCYLHGSRSRAKSAIYTAAACQHQIVIYTEGVPE